MVILSYSEVYTVSIKKGNSLYEPHRLDNHTYARIDGNWKHNTGGGVFDWRSCHNLMCRCGCGETQGYLLEVEFQKTPQMRDKKLNDILI